mgnify:CR=1 FL=1
MDKPAIKKFAIWARNKLKKDAEYCAEQIGITKEKIVPPLPQSTEETLFFDSPTGEPYKLVGKANIKKYRSLVESLKRESANKEYSAVYDSLIERAAYTWFNRMIAVRYMEVNDLLPSHTRVLSATDERKKEPQIVENPSEAILDYTPEEIKQIQDWQYNIGKNGVADMLFRMLFLKQCYALNEVLPKLFDNEDGYLELLLRINFTDADGVVYHLTHDIKEENWRADKTDNAVQIVGWLYQYYNTEPKEQVFANLKKNIKISKENIPAATQLFTPDWIVRYMVENSLGRLHVESVVSSQWSGASGQWSEENEKERIEKEKEIAEQMGWKYYLPEAEQSSVVRDQCSVISGQCSVDSDQTDHCPLTTDHSPLSTEHSPLTTLKCIDPCMGSGHILAYLFDVLMQIYTAAGYSKRDAAASIVEHNLYGLDIDDRAAQMAYFVVMMKGCQYDSRFLRRHLNPHVYAIKESNGISTQDSRAMGDFLADNHHRDTLNYLLTAFANAKEYGSILQLEKRDYAGLLQAWQDTAAATVPNFTMAMWYSAVETLVPQLIRQAILLTQQYDVVVTNPPYMASSGMNAKLSDYVKKFYPDSKSDLFAVFIERCAQMDKPGGYQAMITQHAWMFLSSFEQMRKNLIANEQIVSLAHLGVGTFEDLNSKVVQSVAFILRSGAVKGYIGNYNRLFEKQGLYEDNTIKADWLVTGKHRFDAKQDNFSKIPGSPVAYWVSDYTCSLFGNKEKLKKFADPRQGLATGDDNKFLRLWYEVNVLGLIPNATSVNEFWEKGGRYAPFNKGGQYRKWYGNYQYVIRFNHANYELLSQQGNKLPSKQYYFQPGVTWSALTSGNFSGRLCGYGCVFAGKGPMCFPFSMKNLLWLCGFMNSKAFDALMGVFAATMDFNQGPMRNVPFILDASCKEITDSKVRSCATLSKSDWDSFETSWDFKRHPLV